MNSSYVVAGNDIKASEYNNLRLDSVPAGVVIAYGNNTPPAGWVACDGSGLDTTTYADLFAIIGYTFGGAGATFNVPNLNTARRVPHGKSGTRPIGTTTSSSKTLSTAELPSDHDHSISSDGAHRHKPLQNEGGSNVSGDKFTKITDNTSYQNTYTTSTLGTHNHGGATGSIGSATAITFDAPFVVFNYIIRY